MTTTLAHGLGGVRDLPVPGWLFYYGAALTLLLSFVALAVLWREPRLERARERRLPFTAGGLVRVGGGATGFALLVLVAATSLGGTDSSGRNLAPTFVYVVFWLGMPLVVVLIGNVWPALNPWRAAADVVARLVPWRPLFEYPERLGRWPAAVALFAFAALELAYVEPARPRALGVAVVLYSLVTWLGMAAFGRAAWLRFGEGFSVYFELLSRLAPLALRARRLFVRPPVVALARPDAVPGTLAVVSVMLGSVGFDGLSRTSWWQDNLTSIRDSLLGSSAAAVDLGVTLANAGGLAAAVAAVAVTYSLAVSIARRSGRNLRDEFVLSLVPIAFAYLVAHYFSLFVYQGQYAVPLASDPFGYGWDLFGTSDVKPNLRALSPETIWYVQVAALVAGHVLGLVLAHERAVTLFRSTRSAVRSQVAMLLLMVLYTVGGMWILSRP